MLMSAFFIESSRQVVSSLAPICGTLLDMDDFVSIWGQFTGHCLMHATTETHQILFWLGSCKVTALFWKLHLNTLETSRCLCATLSVSLLCVCVCVCKCCSIKGVTEQDIFPCALLNLPWCADLLGGGGSYIETFCQSPCALLNLSVILFSQNIMGSLLPCAVLLLGEQKSICCTLQNALFCYLRNGIVGSEMHGDSGKMSHSITPIFLMEWHIRGGSEMHGDSGKMSHFIAPPPYGSAYDSVPAAPILFVVRGFEAVWPTCSRFAARSSPTSR